MENLIRPELNIIQKSEVTKTIESRFNLLLFEFDELDDSFGCLGVEDALRPSNQESLTGHHVNVEHHLLCSSSRAGFGPSLSLRAPPNFDKSSFIELGIRGFLGS